MRFTALGFPTHDLAHNPVWGRQNRIMSMIRIKSRSCPKKCHSWIDHTLVRQDTVL